MGLLDRHGKDGHSTVRTAIGPTHRAKVALQAQVRKHVESGAEFFTDAHSSLYRPERHLHARRHRPRREVCRRADPHQRLRNFWSLLKRAINGTYVSVEPFHLFRYLDEQSFRFNNRKLTDAERFAYAAAAIVGKRLTYKSLIGADLMESRTN